MRVRLDLDQTTYDALVTSAVRELRPASLQAEVLLKRALGLPFPPAACPKEDEPPAGTQPVSVETVNAR
jgi:hypothetical protein